VRRAKAATLAGEGDHVVSLAAISVHPGKAFWQQSPTARALRAPAEAKLPKLNAICVSRYLIHEVGASAEWKLVYRLADDFDTGSPMTLSPGAQASFDAERWPWHC